MCRPTLTLSKKCAGVLLAGILSVTSAFSQHLVRGTVTDANAEPIPGAAVQVKGSSDGVITDIDGRFAISVPDKKSTLVVSSLGFLDKEVAANMSGTMNIVLDSDVEQLEEVMVIGYQEVKKSDLTGAVAKANLNDMLDTPVASFDQALGGRVAGVVVTSNEGMPGASMNIVIRGNNSLTQDNSPLYVIDGFPVEDAAIASSINPADIESLNILKDASATAIYGARGANGVVIIETKKGKVGRMQISYDGSVTYHEVSRKIEMMDAYEFVKLQMEVAPEYISRPTGGYLMEWEGKQWTLEDYRNIPQYDWQDEIFRPAWQHSHNLRVSGGTKDVRYNASVSYYDQDGVVLNSNYNKLQARMNTVMKRNRLTVNLTADFSMTSQTGASPSQNSYSGMNNLFYSVWGYRPVNYPNRALEDLMKNAIDADVVNPSNDYRYQPVLSLKNEYNKRNRTYLRLNGYAEYEFINGLKLKVSGGYTNSTPTEDKFNNSKTRYGGPTSTDKVNARIRRQKSISWLNENVLSYQKTFNRYHSFSALAGITFQASSSEDYQAYAHHIPNESLGMAGMGEGTPGEVKSSKGAWSLMSYLARVNYSYKSKYYLTASFRADGSSKFSRKNRFGYFPSASLAWNMAGEDFMKSQSAVNLAKFRLSWGMTGNNRVGDFDRYTMLGVAMSGNEHGVYSWNGEEVAGMVPTNLGNEDLMWETTEQWNLGLDLGFIDDRISFTADLYRKTTYDLLLEATLPYSSGYKSAKKNIGRTRNSGVELTLSTVNIMTRNFMWTTDFNIAFNRNEVLELAENQESLFSVATFDQNYNNNPNYFTGVGYPMGLMYGYIYEGTYKLDEFNQSGNSYSLKPGIPYFNGENNTQPGMPKYRDLNGDGVIDSSDRTIIGNGAPVHTGGITNNFAYKGFDLNIFFQWSYGNDVMNANRLFFESGKGKARDFNQFASYADRWTLENPDSDIPAATASVSNNVISSRIVEDASYLRLKAVTFGYTFPTKLISRAKLAKVRIYVAANNLWTWTKYSGYDPEVSIRNSALTPGLDYSSYPRTRSFSFGVNLGF